MTKADFVDNLTKTGKSSFLLSANLSSVLLDHTFMVVCSYCCQSLRYQVVVSKTRFDLYDVAGTTKVIDRLDEQKFDTSTRTFWQSFECAFCFGASWHKSMSLEIGCQLSFLLKRDIVICWRHSRRRWRIVVES